MKNLKRFTVDAAADGASPLARHHAGVRRATDTGGELASVSLAALPVARGAAPHPRLDMLMGPAIGGVMQPLGRAGGHGGDWIICRTPQGPSLGASQWGQGDHAGLVQRVARVAAGALARLEHVGLTHRAINPFNIFPAGDSVELGPFWSAPPAFAQPAVFEPIVSASCHRSGRGPGTVADDIYALGVTLLSLYLGEVPLAGVPDEEVLERKLWQGSAAALLRGQNLPSALAELIGAMISDEPSQRPRPERLEGGVGVLGPNASSRRRINAALPLMIGEREVWTTTQLAWTIATDGDVVLRALLNGQVEAWLRRGLNEIVLAERIESLVHPSGKEAGAPEGREAEALFLARAGTLLDAPSPVTWKGLRFLPDGLPGLLGAVAGGDEAFRGAVTGLLESGVAGPQSCATRSVGADRPRPWSRFAVARLSYELNPACACASTALAGRPAATIDALLRALEDASEGVQGAPLDAEMAAFIAAKQRAPVVNGELADERAQLKVLAHFSIELRVNTLPNLARRLAAVMLRDIDAWPGTTGRARRQTRIEQVVRAGDLAALHEMASNTGEITRERRRQLEAHGKIQMLRLQQEALAKATAGRLRDARHFGREAASVVAIVSGALVLLLTVLA